MALLSGYRALLSANRALLIDLIYHTDCMGDHIGQGRSHTSADHMYDTSVFVDTIQTVWYITLVIAS